MIQCAHGNLPAIFTTSGSARTCVLLQVYAFPGIPKAIWLTEALPAPLTNSYAPDEFICPITHEVMVDAVTIAGEGSQAPFAE